MGAPFVTAARIPIPIDKLTRIWLTVDKRCICEAIGHSVGRAIMGPLVAQPSLCCARTAAPVRAKWAVATNQLIGPRLVHACIDARPGELTAHPVLAVVLQTGAIILKTQSARQLQTHIEALTII